MIIYWCHERGEDCGLYVVAERRGRAKSLFSSEIGVDFNDVRATIVHKDVESEKEQVLHTDADLMAEYGLSYVE